MNRCTRGQSCFWLIGLVAAFGLSAPVVGQNGGPADHTAGADALSKQTVATPTPGDLAAVTVVKPPSASDASTPTVQTKTANLSPPSSTNPITIVQPPATKPVTSLDWIEQGIRILAVIVGAVWVWANYLLNRTHRARLEARIVGEVLPVGAGLVKIALTLKNVGLSKVDIIQEGTGVIVYWYDATNANEPWQKGMTTAIWNSVSWIEPGETCEEQQVLQIPPAVSVPVKFELFVICEHKPWLCWRPIKQTLRGSYILSPPPKTSEVPYEYH